MEEGAGILTKRPQEEELFVVIYGHVGFVHL
jgi:hypothetical protein